MWNELSWPPCPSSFLFLFGEFHFYPGQKRYKSENGLHTARARHRPALPAVAPWPVPLLKRHGVELAHDDRAVCGRADHPLARPVMLLSWRAALALARGADMLLGPACSSHSLALTSAALSDMRGVRPTREPVCGMRMRVPNAFLLPPLKSVGEEDGSAAMLRRAV